MEQPPPPSRYTNDGSGEYGRQHHSQGDRRGREGSSGKRGRESEEYGSRSSSQKQRWDSSHRGYQMSSDASWGNNNNKRRGDVSYNDRNSRNHPPSYYRGAGRQQHDHHRENDRDGYYGPPSSEPKNSRDWKNNDSSSSREQSTAAAGNQRTRSNSTSRRYHEHHNDDWKCLECKTWNYSDEHRCARCGRRSDDVDTERYSNEPSFSRDDDHGSRGRRSDSYDHRDYHRRHDSRSPDEGDEFGRPEKRRSNKRNKKEETTKKFLWPPIFEQDGSSYVFDARSSFFYEAKSNFFYDPKTKLYYSNDKKVYYRHCPSTATGGEIGHDNSKDGSSTSSLFQEVSADGTAGKGEGNYHQNDAILELGGGSQQQQPPTAAKIAICLKTKKLTSSSKKVTKKDSGGSSTAASAAGSALPENNIRKKHQADMDVWAKREKEIRGEMPTTTSPSPSAIVKTTKKGLPICLLCKRKFGTIEKLRQHEQLSSLHKSNLEKAEAAKKDNPIQQSTDNTIAVNQLAAQQENQDQNYRDRAQERRVMHGPESSIATAADTIMAEEEHRTTDIVRPEDNLGSSNIGNQMLQKLGWKAGNSLGNSGADAGHGSADTDSHEEASVQQQSKSGNNNGGTSLQKTVLKDWERIESLASQGQTCTGVSSRAGIGSKY